MKKLYVVIPVYGGVIAFGQADDEVGSAFGRHHAGKRTQNLRQGLGAHFRRSPCCRAE